MSGRRRGDDFFRNFERALETARSGDADVVVHRGDRLFRRNLWAVKSVGIIVTATAALVVCAEMYGSVAAHQQVGLIQPLIVVVDVLLLLAWTFVVTTKWVKRAAVLYAERLLEALDALV